MGKVFIISAASGTGKTTLVQKLLAADSNLSVSVSHTTRQARIGEIDGQHYHFVSSDQFETMIAQQAFLEYANVFGNYYGTSAAEVQKMCQQGWDVILEIDVQGAAQVRQKLPESVSIFILPPSLAVLEQRLRNRQTDSDEVIARRLAEAEQEISQAINFDYLVINENLVQAHQDLQHIIAANRLNPSDKQTIIEQLLHPK